VSPEPRSEERFAERRSAVLGPAERLLMVVGGYGSGKTEASVNLALDLSRYAVSVQIADLDLVNPYFRCREARALMRRHGIRVVVPPDAQVYADLPIVLPEIRALLNPPRGTVSILDVGGDDVGARVLASFRPDLAEGSYELWQVINARRPFTDTVAGCLRVQQAMEASSRLKTTGLLVNTHLCEETTPEIVLEGWHLAREVSVKRGVPIRAVAVMEHLASSPHFESIDVPILRLRRRMLPPWLQ